MVMLLFGLTEVELLSMPLALGYLRMRESKNNTGGRDHELHSFFWRQSPFKADDPHRMVCVLLS